MAQWWSSKANGTTIFYKLREHLTTQYTKWTDQQHGIRSLIASEKQRAPNTKRIRSKHHSASVLAAASRLQPGVPADARASPVQIRELQNIPEAMQMEDVQPTAVSDETPMDDVQFFVAPDEVDQAFLPQDAPAPEEATIQLQQDVLAPPTLSFMPWSLNHPKKKEKKCAICHQSSCPGRGNRALCRHHVTVSEIQLSFELCKLLTNTQQPQ